MFNSHICFLIPNIICIDGTTNINPSALGARTYWANLVKTIAADAPAVCVAKAAAVVLKCMVNESSSSSETTCAMPLSTNDTNSLYLGALAKQLTRQMANGEVEAVLSRLDRWSPLGHIGMLTQCYQVMSYTRRIAARIFILTRLIVKLMATATLS